MSARHTGLVAVAAALVLSAQPAAAQYGAVDGEWRSYAGDNGSTKYSPLDQIDAGNFDDLRIAWRWQSADGQVDLEALRESEDDRPISIRGLQATPLMIDGVLYLTTALYQAAAVDAGTGETLWVHDPQAYQGGAPTHSYRSRGLAYWSDGDDARIFWGTSEAYLIAVDARTGEPVRDFGDNGRVDLTEGVPRAERGATNYQGRNLVGVASPPVITRDVVVTPTIISDFVVRKEAPPGWVKGIDARTGDVRWTFRTIPQADDLYIRSRANPPTLPRCQLTRCHSRSLPGAVCLCVAALRSRCARASWERRAGTGPVSSRCACSEIGSIP